MKTVADIQRRLFQLGFNPGPIDSVRGRQTIAAIERFQAAMGLEVDGIVGPKTHHKLFGESIDPAASPDAMPWLVEARRLMGVKEASGKANNPTIMDWAEQLDIAYPNDEVPWCGLFVAHCIGATLPREPLPSNPLGARNWASFGDACPLADGAVAVFWRGSKAGWLGHVGIVVGQTASTIELLGGNQSNQVSVVQMPKSRLLATRWPKTALKVVKVTQGGSAAMTNGNEA